MSDKRGMTLIEVMVALFILALCIIPISSGLLVAKKQAESSEKGLQALGLAQGKLEELMNHDFADIEDVATAVDFPGPYAGYSYTVDVNNDTTYPATLKIIKVTVYYAEAGTGIQKSVEITGARAKR